ncbi:MAG: amidohydrolase family protein [Acidimicrobiia bacterium]|nr:amidohydrolase family protein [Acidimicrobiia bacterium]
MATLLKLNLRDGSRLDIAVERGWFVDPDLVRIDGEIDLGGYVAIGGLVDAHAHFGADGVRSMIDSPPEDDLAALRARATAQLEAGVLTVADKGGKTDEHLALLAEPLTDVPNLHMAGAMMASPGGYYPNFGLKVEPQDLSTAVADRCATPASWVKIVGDWPRREVGVLENFDGATLARAVEVAHAAGRKVAIHTMGRDAPSSAVAAGVDSVEHGLFLTEADLETLGARGGHWVPTVVAMEYTMNSLRAGSTGARVIGEGLENVARLLPLAEEAGVVLLTGTDLAVAHGEVAREAVRLVEYGLSSRRAFEAITRRSAFDAVTGLVPGMAADLVLVGADPVDHIETLLHAKGVLRNGRWVKRP